jgi:hypothetical protein
MTLRLIVWAIILALVFARSRKHAAAGAQRKPLPN